MKKNILSAFAAGLMCLTAICSCTSFLNVEKIGKSTIESFFSEIGGMTASGEGLHKEIMSFYTSSGLLLYGDIAGNQVVLNTVDADEATVYTYEYRLLPEHVSTYVRWLWSKGYAVVTAANNIISFGGDFRDNKARENEIAECDKVIGWAYYARALAIFDLARCYGQAYNFTPDASHPGVPTVTHVPGFDEQIPRKTVAEDFKLVISDLETAMELLGPEEKIKDCTHISRTACEALLAKVYLYMEDWENAEKYARIVMDKVPLTPRNEYVDMFRSPRKNLGAESIFRLDSYDYSTSFLGKYDPTRGHDLNPDPTLVDYFDDDDIRKQLLYYVGEDCEEDAYRGKTFYSACKHLPYKSIDDPDDKHPYEFVARCSEMYLIHAEAVTRGAKHDLAAAADDLKALLSRAKGREASAIPISCTSENEMMSLIEKERVRELCTEGHCFFDYKRWNKDIVRSSASGAKVKELKYPDHRFALPIDYMEMEANDVMVQNEGY